MSQVIVDTKSRKIVSASITASFDYGKKLLENEGYRIISLQENARLRIYEGINANVSREGNWVREGVIYVPGKGAYLTKNSPIMAHAKKAVNCHDKGPDFYLTNAQLEQSLADSVRLIGQPILTKDFGSNEITVYAFGKTAERYGQFLEEAGISDLPILLAHVQDKAFVLPVKFGHLDGVRTIISCNKRDLSYGCLRGIKNISELEKSIE